MSLDLRLVAANWVGLGGAVSGGVAIKTAVTFGLLRFTGTRPGTAAEAGVLMSSPSETTLIVLGVATQAQLILPSTAAFWQTVTAIGLTLTPLLARVGQNEARRLERRPGHADPEVVTDTHGPVPAGTEIGRTRVGETEGQ